MRGTIALLVGLVSLVVVDSARAGVSIGECGVCECADDGRRLCMQDVGVNRAECVEFCGSTDVLDFSAGFVQCSEVRGCPQASGNAGAAAPTASAYGTAALLLGLSAFGLWRLRKPDGAS